MLNDLAAQDSSTALARRLRRYTTLTVLLVDEVGYLSYDSRAADLLFEVVSRRHEQRSIILTTNKPFAEWNEVFPNGQKTDGHSTPTRSYPTACRLLRLAEAPRPRGYVRTGPARSGCRSTRRVLLRSRAHGQRTRHESPGRGSDSKNRPNTPPPLGERIGCGAKRPVISTLPQPLPEREGGMG